MRRKGLLTLVVTREGVGGTEEGGSGTVGLVVVSGEDVGGTDMTDVQTKIEIGGT